MVRHELGIIGAGNMAEALLRGALAKGVIAPEAVVVSDPQPRRREVFARGLGVTAAGDNALPGQCPRVLLAVKPQVMAEVLDGLAGVISADALVISIAAGIRTAFIARRLGGKGRIVRVMPNTPMLVSAGVSALCKGPGATQADLDWTERLFAACGRTVRLEEPLMDAVTAVSGSGPAYFFYLIEAMVAAGVEEGLSPEAALELAVQTCRGAAELLCRSGESPQSLRAKVTSPGGTTQAAIEVLQGAGVQETLVRAIRRAAARSRELGK
jgi:pyrroline-5-carboxylate reductase